MSLLAEENKKVCRLRGAELSLQATRCVAAFMNVTTFVGIFENLHNVTVVTTCDMSMS